MFDQKGPETVNKVRPAPTVIGDTPGVTSHPVTLPAEVKAVPMPKTGPTSMGGQVCERLHVTADELLKLQSTSQQPVIDKAIAILRQVIVSNLKDTDAILWGSGVQKAYGDAASRGLKLAQADVFNKAEEKIARLIEILGSIRLDRVFVESRSMLTRFIRRSSKEIDTPEELKEARVEVQQLVDRLTKKIDVLLKAKTEVEEFSSEVEALRVDAAAWSVAAAYLSGRLKLTSPDLAQRLADRADSLTATCAQILADGTIRKMQVERPMQLITTIQNVVLVTLPGIIAALAAIASASSSSRPTVTQLSDLQDQVTKAVEGLKNR